ncbi:UNVERIFIED_CONTAM: hypothetical protein PYX00_009731 [Menopon gallinae]|uniref:tRNA-splicing endonuclease subunit Sen2 n=1 Tax=Menopon gallinae TaxID=328185 RepID=A0AAW2HCS4_9NEOP
MDSKRFKRKKFAPTDVKSKFPRLVADEPYTGVFDGHSVSIIDVTSMNDIYNEGNFGKGSLSKSAPTYNLMDDMPTVLMQQQWENHLKWGPTTKSSMCVTSEKGPYTTSISSVQNFLNTATSVENNSWKQWKSMNQKDHDSQCTTGNIQKQVCNKTSLVTSNGSNSIDNNDLNPDDPLFNLVEEILQTGKIKEPRTCNEDKVLVVKPSLQGNLVEETNISDASIRLKNKIMDIKETLKLNLTEAFFLSFVLKCLRILDKNGHELSLHDLWKRFNETEENFISKYVAYHQYRAHGWTVRSGLKFGGDYLLYKTGPAYYHASYLVWILDQKRKKMTWDEFAALNRLTETCNKDLILCQIIGPDVNQENSPDVLRKYEVLEMVSKRWIPTQEREVKKSEEN